MSKLNLRLPNRTIQTDYPNFWSMTPAEQQFCRDFHALVTFGTGPLASNLSKKELQQIWRNRYRERNDLVVQPKANSDALPNVVYVGNLHELCDVIPNETNTNEAEDIRIELCDAADLCGIARRNYLARNNVTTINSMLPKTKSTTAKAA